MTSNADAPEQIAIERTYATSVEHLWELWTTKEGIEAWWAPDGFDIEVTKLDLAPGGELLYATTATGPDQVAFMERAGMPLTNVAHKIYTEVVPTERLVYVSRIDFVPDVEPYEHETVVTLEPAAEGAFVVRTVDRMHDEEWTRRLVMGRENELDNLTKLLAARPTR